MKGREGYIVKEGKGEKEYRRQDRGNEKERKKGEIRLITPADKDHR